jgi:hypothetical protein
MANSGDKSDETACYMCEAPAVSREHAPPACFFPEAKDLPDGIDLRRNLITVPSCDAHNSKKSHDDEYLWFHIIASNAINECGQNMVRTKGLRQIQRRAALGNALMKTATPAYSYDAETASWKPTAKVQFDGPRFYGALEKVGRALYYHHFGHKWARSVVVIPRFTLFSGEEPSAIRSAWRKVLELADLAFSSGSKRYGDNQDAFLYQVYSEPEAKGLMLRATFYGHAAITLFFTETQAPPYV